MRKSKYPRRFVRHEKVRFTAKNGEFGCTGLSFRKSAAKKARTKNRPQFSFPLRAAAQRRRNWAGRRGGGGEEEEERRRGDLASPGFDARCCCLTLAPSKMFYFSKTSTFAFGGLLQLFGGQTYSFSDYSQALQLAPLSLS